VRANEQAVRALRPRCQHVFQLPANVSGPGEPFLGFSSSSLKPELTNITPEYLRDNDPTLFMRIIYFPEFDEAHAIRPKIIVKLSESVHQDLISVVETLIKFFVNTMLRRQYSSMRRAIINAKIDSDDLGSFLHRLLHRQFFQKYLTAEACSVFAVNHQSRMLHLRGSTGLRRDLPTAAINFHVDEDLNVTKVFRQREPQIEYQNGERLSEGKSAEATKAGAYTKAYWPLQVRATSSPHARLQSHRPCAGVVRIVNRTNLEIDHAPFTWMPICCLVYTAESLYNVLEAFTAIDSASFNKDAAFHGAVSLVDTIAKNIDIVRRQVFADVNPPMPDETPLYYLAPRVDATNRNPDRLHPGRLGRLLNTAYASARSLGFQIERTNLGLPKKNTEVTRKLITDVLLRALELIDDMCISHSASEAVIRPSARDLLDGTERPPPVRGSPEALTSVFANLCENSVKYRQQGRAIRIKIDIASHKHYVEVAFRDFGIGILDGEEKRVFTRGYRTPRAISFVVRGDGLGLAWCKEVLEHYGGGIAAERRDDGLTILVRLARVETRL
jgi:hypothetical protein